ncbi:Aspartate aminotransferase, partial [Durusdinium trenchii]
AALEDPMMTFGQGLPRPTAVTPTAAPAAVPAMVGPGPVAKAAEAAYAAVRKSRAPAVGTPELWHAVHVGDEITIARLIHQQLCNGLQRDASGHSVLWHAIAFGHGGIAKRMLERFPVGSE